MRLVSFSVQNYRSITNAPKIPVSDYSLLVGANNEGKSNILHALILAMRTLSQWHLHTRINPQTGKLVHLATRMNRPYGYDWDRDFPVGKQEKSNSKSRTKITLEFELNPTETAEFKGATGSNLNGTLPILVSFSQNSVEVSVKKQGRGHATLNNKSNKVAEFVSKSIRFEYIPAIRTAESAERVISDLVQRELRKLEADSQYTEAIAKIEELQRPIFEDMSNAIQSTVTGFLPSVKSRGGSVCLNRIRCFRKWISALVMPPPGLASAH